MKYTIGEKKNGKLVVTFNLTAEEWEAEVEKAYQKNKGKYKLQGFRQGKVPRKVLEQTFGEYMFYEDAFNDACPRLYTEMLDKEPSIYPVSYPEIDVKEFTEKGVEFTATITLLPEVVLGDYKNIVVESKTIKVTESEVKKELEVMREKQVRYNEVSDRACKLGDLVNIDFSGSIDGKVFEGGTAHDMELELGSHTFIDNFEDQIAGMQIGEEKDVNVTFPANYHAKDLAGKPAVFKTKLLSIREKVLPELNDAFASDVSQFNTLDELKADIKHNIKHSKEHHEEHRVENELINKVVANATVEVPDVMVENQLDAFVDDIRSRLAYQGLRFEDYLAYMNTTEQAYRETRSNEAAQSVKVSLVLQEIVKAEKIEATKEDIDAKLAELAERMGKKPAELKKTMTADQESVIVNNIISEKVIKLLKELNNIK